MNTNMALKLRFLLILIIIPAGALAVMNHIGRMTMSNTAEQDPNWSELMRSMKAMHATMTAAQPSGNDDEDFVNLMLPHHQAVVEMAKTELLHGKDPQMRRLAQEIIADQESEIQLMQLWLDQQRAGLKNPHQPQFSGLPREK